MCQRRINLAWLGAVVALLSTHTDAAVALYGRIDTDLEIQKGAGGTATQLVDDASRWGIRGSEELSGSLRTAFGLEQGFAVDSGMLLNPAFRHAFVGLSGKLGAIALGRLDSGTIVGSPIYSQVVRNVSFLFHDAGATAFGNKVLNGRNRVSNAIGYMTPDVSGFRARFRLNLAGPEQASGSAISPIRQEDDFRQFDSGIDYTSGKFSAGIGYARDTKAGGLVANDFRDKIQMVASYHFTIADVYGVYGRDRYVSTTSTRSRVPYWLLGCMIPMGVHSATLNYMERAVQGDPLGKLRKIQAGYGYSLSKRTTLYAFFDREDSNSHKPGDTVTTYGAGVQHRF
ncbi:porin (plasmid) [Cupriavidus oxalaticus]|uniref:Porin n=2 Tax=Cupriavidus oxalaticus TaxID=96344 RepID=A0A5P3VS09_9BURK|nr:porin [Cupriavidus oxalaticus]